MLFPGGKQLEGVPGTGTFCRDDGAGIHNIVQLRPNIHPNDTEPKACYALHILPWPDPGFQLGET